LALDRFLQSEVQVIGSTLVRLDSCNTTLARRQLKTTSVTRLRAVLHHLQETPPNITSFETCQTCGDVGQQLHGAGGVQQRGDALVAVRTRDVHRPHVREVSHQPHVRRCRLPRHLLRLRGRGNANIGFDINVSASRWASSRMPRSPTSDLYHSKPGQTQQDSEACKYWQPA